jgi:DNA polymerase-3 subunit delta'
MQLAALKGQQRVVDLLRRSIGAHRVAHAYLFEGPDGCGRRTTALALIQALFCKEPVNGDACTTCSSCRRLTSGNHPDLHCVSPLPDKRDISIDQIRELQQILSLRPFEANRKACLIEPAERMNEKSANALLKTLEEPPGHAIILLLTTQADLLLATIRSRCQHLRFSPLDDGTVAELLVQQGMDLGKAAEVAPLAEGSMERATALEEASDASQRQELLSLLRKTSSKQITTVFDTAESLAGGRDETLALFSLVLSLLRDLLLIRSGGHVGIANRFLYAELAAEAARFTPAGIMELLEHTLETRQAVQGNANPKLALEHFLLTYDRLRKGV